jgi:hypothetical protein
VEVNQSYRAIEALRVPTLASVQGIAMGGGFELALACDLIIAAEDAVFQNVEVTTGMVPIAGGMLGDDTMRSQHQCGGERHEISGHGIRGQDESGLHPSVSCPRATNQTYGHIDRNQAMQMFFGAKPRYKSLN